MDNGGGVEQVEFSICGQTFVTTITTLGSVFLRDSVLANCSPGKTHYFDRSPAMFSAILDYARTGLFPRSADVDLLLEELDFFKVYAPVDLGSSVALRRQVRETVVEALRVGERQVVLASSGQFSLDFDFDAAGLRRGMLNGPVWLECADEGVLLDACKRSVAAYFSLCPSLVCAAAKKSYTVGKSKAHLCEVQVRVVVIAREEKKQ